MVRTRHAVPSWLSAFERIKSEDVVKQRDMARLYPARAVLD